MKVTALRSVRTWLALLGPGILLLSATFVPRFGNAQRESSQPLVIAREIDVTARGVVPGSDVTAAVESLVNAMPEGTIFHFPAANKPYRFSRTITVNRELFTLEGAGKAIGSNAGTLFVGNFAGPILQLGQKGTYKISGVGFRNDHPEGKGLEFAGTNQGSTVAECSFACKGAGLVVENAKNFMSLQNYFRGCGLGASIHGHATVLGNQFIGNSEGLWLSHYGIYAHQLRFEVNGTALRLGREWNGAPGGKKDPMGGFALSTMTFEANDIAIVFHGGKRGTIGNFGIYGTTNAPSGASQIGIDLADAGSEVKWFNGDTHGSFTQAGLLVRKRRRASATEGQYVFEDFHIENLRGGAPDLDAGWVLEDEATRDTRAARRLAPEDLPNGTFVRTNVDSDPSLEQTSAPRREINENARIRRQNAEEKEKSRR